MSPRRQPPGPAGGRAGRHPDRRSRSGGGRGPTRRPGRRRSPGSSGPGRREAKKDDDALNLGTTVIPILFKTYWKQALAALVVLAIIIWLITRL